MRQGAIKSQAFRHVTGSGSSGAARAIYCVSDEQPIATIIVIFLMIVHILTKIYKIRDVFILYDYFINKRLYFNI